LQTLASAEETRAKKPTSANKRRWYLSGGGKRRLGIPQASLRPPNAKAANNDTANASAKASATATARGKPSDCMAFLLNPARDRMAEGYGRPKIKKSVIR